MTKGKVEPLQMTRERALKMIRAAAADSAQVFVTDHANQQMRKRRISLTQVLEVLRVGSITEGPAPSVKGNWECVVERFVAGDAIAVVAAIELDERRQPIIVVTAYRV